MPSSENKCLFFNGIANYYRIPLAKRRAAEQEIQQMAEDRIIEKCPKTAWNVPGVMVTKPDLSIRFCCDFRGLNEVTVKDCQSLPRIENSVDALSGSKWWSCLDMKSGYWQIDIAEEDRHLTAFSVPGGNLPLASAMPPVPSLG